MVHEAFGVKAGDLVKACPDRISFADVAVARATVVRFLSAYFFCGEGLSQRNRNLFAELVLLVLNCRFPWCLGCAFSMTPEMVVESGFLKQTGATIISTGKPTCFQADTEYDFFVVSPLLAEFAKEPRILEAPCLPHAPVNVPLSKLRSQQVIFKHRAFLKPVVGAVGPKQVIEEANFTWKVGEEEPSNFEQGFKEWLKVFEKQICLLNDLTRKRRAKS